MSGDAFFAWLHNHKAEAACECDCLARAAAFAAGRKAGRRDAMQRSAYVQLVPLMRQLLDELVEDRVDAEFESLEPSPLWSTNQPLGCEQVEDSPGSWHWEHTDECVSRMRHA